MYDVDRSEELEEIDVTEDEIVVARRSKTGNPDISDKHDSALGDSAAENADVEEDEDARVETGQTNVAGDDDDNAEGAKKSDEVEDEKRVWRERMTTSEGGTSPQY
jgi:hypothetical protein